MSGSVGVITRDSSLEARLRAALPEVALSIEGHAALLEANYEVVVIDLACPELLRPPFVFADRDDIVLIDRTPAGTPFSSFRRPDVALVTERIRAALRLAPPSIESSSTLSTMERDLVLRAYQNNHGNLSRAARALGVARTTFRGMLGRHAPQLLEARTKSPRHRRGRGVVLVVDDDPNVLDALGAALRRAGYEAIECLGGKTALEQFDLHLDRVDAVVCDVVMPQVSGADVVQVLHARRASLPFVFMSGYPFQRLVTTGSFDATHTFLQKPFSTTQLVSALQAVMK